MKKNQKNAYEYNSTDIKNMRNSVVKVEVSKLKGAKMSSNSKHQFDEEGTVSYSPIVGKSEIADKRIESPQVIYGESVKAQSWRSEYSKLDQVPYMTSFDYKQQASQERENLEKQNKLEASKHERSLNKKQKG